MPTRHTRGAAARKWATAWVNSFDRLTQEPIEFIDAGDDQVLVEFIQRGWTAGSDVPVELRTWSVSTALRDGAFLRTRLFNHSKRRPWKPPVCRSSRFGRKADTTDQTDQAPSAVVVAA